MCGRFVMVSDLSDIVEEFAIEKISATVEKSFNIAPGANVAAVIRDGVTRLVSLQWGLIPSWTRDGAGRKGLINARAETVTSKPSFRDAFRDRRCLIIADGYYEWKGGEKGRAKTPFYIYLKSRKPFGFAGIYEQWLPPGGKQVLSCAIITTEPNELVSPIHKRMPVIIPREQHRLWLDPALSGGAVLCDLMRPIPAGDMVAYPVSTKVNFPIIDTPDCIKPVGDHGLVRI